MIQLRSDCLVFKTSDGETIPCSAEEVTVELIGDSASELDPELIRNASAAVLHYFRTELKQECVSVNEFSQALVRVLRGFGLDVSAAGESASTEDGPAIVEADLRLLAWETGKGFELAFFPQLRQLLRQKSGESPDLLRLRGLRGCVKQLTGARRWSRRCQRLHDQIVQFARQCWSAEGPEEKCALLVR